MTISKGLSRRFTAILITLLLLLTSAGCNGASGGQTISGPTKTVTDLLGRDVEIPEDAERVICMYASTAHMMALLNRGERIVGAADGVTRDQMMITMYPALEDVPTPYHEGAVNAEEVMALNPDLIIIKREMYEKDTEKQKLDDLGIPYVVVDYLSVEELKTSIRIMGNVFGEQEKAEAYIAYMEQTFSEVEARLQGISETDRPRVYHAITEATKTDLVDSLCADIMDRAGLIDVSAAAGTTSLGRNATVTLEQIYSWDPDAIVCNEYAVADYIKANKKWNGLSSVQNNQVYTLPIGATRWCHHGSMEPHMAVLFLAKTFYPDRFEDVNLWEITRQYYADFFGMTLDDAALDKIFSGRGMRESSPTLEME